MIQLATHELCSGCSGCFSVCPGQAISMRRDGHGALYPEIDSEKCIECHACEKICYLNCSPQTVPAKEPLCYAAAAKDKTLRLASSSGGFFSELASRIIARNGVVFGCVFEEDYFSAFHTSAENMEDTAKMRGSKYLQSDLRNSFREAKAALEAGRQVLFTGTPCQIAGLNKFLGKGKYSGLVTMEVICHGAPLPGVWEKYLQETKLNKITSVNFRNKKFGWKGFHMYIAGSKKYASWEKNKVILQKAGDNPFMYAFMREVSLRPSCFQCRAKGGSSGADITVGDLWGSNKLGIGFRNDNTGISAVILHTEKGKEIFGECRKNLLLSEVALSDITAKNPYYCRSVEKPEKYEFFMENYSTRMMDSLMCEIDNKPLFVFKLRRFFRTVKQIFRKNKF